MAIVKNPKGLGDSIHNLTVRTGIKKAVDTVSQALNTDCGCNHRRKTLNDLFPYNKKT